MPDSRCPQDSTVALPQESMAHLELWQLADARIATRAVPLPAAGDDRGKLLKAGFIDVQDRFEFREASISGAMPKTFAACGLALAQRHANAKRKRQTIYFDLFECELRLAAIRRDLETVVADDLEFELLGDGPSLNSTVMTSALLATVFHFP